MLSLAWSNAAWSQLCSIINDIHMWLVRYGTHIPSFPFAVLSSAVDVTTHIILVAADCQQSYCICSQLLAQVKHIWLSVIFGCRSIGRELAPWQPPWTNIHFRQFFCRLMKNVSVWGIFTHTQLISGWDLCYIYPYVHVHGYILYDIYWILGLVTLASATHLHLMLTYRSQWFYFLPEGRRRTLVNASSC